MNDLTFCMPVYNGAATIKMSLTRIHQQGILGPNVLVNLTWSLDGTAELLAALIKYDWFKGMEINVFSGPRPDSLPGKVPAHASRYIALARKQLVDRVTTPFLMFVDCDVLLWPDTVLTLLKEIREDEAIGMLGIPYNGSNHVQMGATILRTIIARELDWNVEDKGCDCGHIASQLKTRGLKVIHSKVERARHLTFDRVGQ